MLRIISNQKSKILREVAGAGAGRQVDEFDRSGIVGTWKLGVQPHKDIEQWNPEFPDPESWNQR